MSIAKICPNSVFSGYINFILGGLLYDDPPTSEAQDGFHGNSGF